MSDNWIILIPEDPRFVPEPARRERAREWLRRVAPDADGIEVRVSDTVEFFHCGGNFERVVCPSCGAEIPLGWWRDRMNEDYGEGFRLAAYGTPCCGGRHTLHELEYEWPEGFGRFAVEVRNANVGKLAARELEGILGVKLRVIYRHV